MQIWGYRQLVAEVECIRKEEYSSANFEHEEKLLRLWNQLMPGTPLEVGTFIQGTFISNYCFLMVLTGLLFQIYIRFSPFVFCRVLLLYGI